MRVKGKRSEPISTSLDETQYRRRGGRSSRWRRLDSLGMRGWGGGMYDVFQSAHFKLVNPEPPRDQAENHDNRHGTNAEHQGIDDGAAPLHIKSPLPHDNQVEDDPDRGQS